jgi:AraC family transcriptional regulator
MPQLIAASILPQAIVAQGNVTRRGGQPPVVTSQASDWPGVLIEAGENDVTEVDDLQVGQHYLSLNADSKPHAFELKGPYGYQRVTLTPQSFWIVPAGDLITLRVNEVFPYVRMAIDPLRLGRLLYDANHGDAAVRLRLASGIVDQQVTNLIMVLLAEAKNQNAQGLALVDAVTTALGHFLLRHAGVDGRPRQPASGGLSPVAKRRTLELIDAQLDKRLTLEILAREAGLSPTHFARAFRETMGRAPHQFLVSLRLERARRLLEQPGAALSDVAHRSGFADQAHLTRLFKHAYGVTPGAYLRDHGARITGSRLRAVG